MQNPISSGVALSLVIAHAAAASTWHVATTGDDTAAGTDAAPWRTIQHAADSVAPGDTVMIHAGTYPGFVVSAHGTQAAPIAFVGSGAVTIDGAATNNQDAVEVDGGSWIEIESLSIANAVRAGVSALNCDHITVSGNHIDNNGKWGVFSGFCEDFVVENNEISNSATQHGIYASNSADNPVIRGNVVTGNAQCGIQINADISQGGDGIITGAIVENNVVRNNGRLGGSGLNFDGVVGAVIRNNVLDGNHASGISLYQEDGGAPSTGNQVINNTIRMASDARWALNIANDSSGNAVRNNILLDANPQNGAISICATCLPGMVSDHNAVVGRFENDGTVVDLPTWRAQTGNDAASMVATDADLFTDPANGDLTLRAGAPAIDHGDPLGAPDVDIAGTPRPQGAGFDIGAYEYAVTSGTGSGSGSGSSGTSGGSDAGSANSGTPSGGGGCNAGGSMAGLPLLGLALLLLRRSRVRSGV